MAALPSPTVLISGAGVSGPALAFWLLRQGYRPTLVEAAPKLREGGYLIDFWGVGYDVAERMALMETLRSRGCHVNELRMVDSDGRSIGAMNVDLLRSATGDRFFSILRSDLAREVYRAIDGGVETIFGDSIAAVEQNYAGVGVTFRHAPTRHFDLLVEADGLHSAVRHLVFGADQQFEDFLGYYVAAFDAAGYPHRDADAYISHTVPRRQIARYAFGDRCAFFFIWAEDNKRDIAHHDIAAQKTVIRQRYRDVGWEAPDIGRALDRCDNLYFDAVSQIHVAP
jgi:2-polyprenyl-6-methoxyphenol hydroxylase-like FAD-dependent oxidoreductase